MAGGFDPPLQYFRARGRFSLARAVLQQRHEACWVGKKIVIAQKIPDSGGATWQDVYTAALIELDPEKLKMLIEDAERAIAIRYMNLDPVQDADEARRLADARRGLSLLRHEAERRA